MQLFAQRPTALDEERQLDGFVATPASPGLRVRRADHAEICWGDHRAQLALDHPAEPSTRASLAAWAARSSTGGSLRQKARYFLRPPLAFTSRHTVEGDPTQGLSDGSI